MPIDFTLCPEQRSFQDDACAFAERVLSPISAHIDAIADPTEAFGFTPAAYREMARAWFTKSFIDFALAVEELARVDVNVPTTLLANRVGLQPVIQFGNAAQRKLFHQPFVDDADGELLAAFAFTEVDGGANFDSDDAEAGVQTFTRRDGDAWAVTGQKHYTTSGSGCHGEGAHLYSVVCRTKGARESLAVVMVPGDAAGVQVIDIYDKLGNRGGCLLESTLRRSGSQRAV